MKPVRRSVKSRTTGRARVRMYLKSGLFWLRGYPSGGGRGWVPAPEPGQERGAESIELDRSVLRKATWTASKLYHKFPRALPAEVGDREAWWQRTVGILALVKERINRDRPWPRPVCGPRKKIESLSKTHPALRPVCDALRWIHFGNDARCRAAVDALGADAPRFVTMLRHLSPESGVRTILRLLDIRIVDGPRPVRFLIDTLGDERAHRVPLVAGESPVPALAANIKRFRSRKASGPLPESDLTRWPDVPEAELAPALVAWLDFACRLDKPERRTALSLVAAILPVELLDRWATWRERVTRRLEEAWNRLHSRRAKDLELKRLKAIRTEVETMWSRCPARFPARWALNVDLADPTLFADRGLSRRILEVARLVPRVLGSSSLRVAFVRGWLDVIRCQGARTLRAVLHGQARLIKAAPEGMAVFRLWDDVAGYGTETRLYHQPFHEVNLLEEDRALDRLPLVYDTLSRYLGSRESLPDECCPLWDTVTQIARATGSAVTADAFLRALESDAASSERRIANRLVFAAVAMAERCPETFGPIDAALGRFDDDRHDPDEFVRFVRECGQASRVGALIRGGRLPQVVELSLLWHSSRLGETGRTARLSVPKAPRGRRAEWMNRYPARLRPRLEHLAAATDDAERVASRVLGRAYPDPEHLRRERRSIKRRLASATGSDRDALARRFENLARRIRNAPVPGTARLDRFGAKIERRTDQAVLEAWRRQLTDAIREPLERRLGFPVEAEWLEERDNAKLLCHLMALRPRCRSLAIRLLKARRRDRPWDLRDDPENRAFIRRMEAAGIAIDPWLNGVEPRVIRGPGGRVSLALEDDPLEVFRMGDPFRTCLSVGDFNFYSTVPNAADINKRVLFARHDDGRVAGRCLLGLTRAGGLLTFHVYAHDRELALPDRVGDFVVDLADRMNTIVVPVGEVEDLHDTNWYDDGPTDLTGRYAFLKDGSAFRAGLATVEPEDLPSRIETALGSLPRNDFTLGMIANLPEWWDHPALIPPLLRFIGDGRGMFPEHLLNLAEAAAGAELRAEVKRMLGWLLGRRGLRSPSPRIPERVAWLAVLTEPALALRLLRTTRPPRVRRWAQEPPDRLVLAARAHAALGRRRQALSLYRQAIQKTARPPDEWKTAVAELEDSLPV